MSGEKLSWIRAPLKLLGLSEEAIDKVIDFVSDLLFEKDEKATNIEYPYHLADEFISAAKLNFFLNLKVIVGDSAHIFSKVKLSDLFTPRPVILQRTVPIRIESIVSTWIFSYVTRKHSSQFWELN